MVAFSQIYILLNMLFRSRFTRATGFCTSAQAGQVSCSTETWGVHRLVRFSAPKSLFLPSSPTPSPPPCLCLSFPPWAGASRTSTGVGAALFLGSQPPASVGEPAGEEPAGRVEGARPLESGGPGLRPSPCRLLAL